MCNPKPCLVIPAVALSLGGAYFEGSNSPLRIEANGEFVCVIAGERCAQPAPLVSLNFDFIYCAPAGPGLDLVNHVAKFRFTNLAAEEHSLAFHLGPVVAPRGPANGAAFRNFQTASLSPDGPLSNSRRHGWTLGTLPERSPLCRVLRSTCQQVSGLLQSARRRPRSLP